MRRLMTDIFVAVAGLLSFLYVLNFGWGFIELVPDNWPIIGNLDEAAATALFLSCLSYFGVQGGTFVNMLRVLSGRPPLALPAPAPAPEQKKEGAGTPRNGETRTEAP